MIMKTYFIAFIISAIAVVSSCKKDDSSHPEDSSSSSIGTTIASGTWKVTYYHESNNDHLLNFNGYQFVFNSNGVMTASNSGGTTTGTWSSDDHNNEFHMSIGSASPLSDLSNGWLIISKTNSQFNLKDDNTAHNEEIHFTKI